MTSVLVVSHSYDGQTALVADRIATGLRTRGCDVDRYVDMVTARLDPSNASRHQRS
jgi:menaquinone-dependent protoporphyrinogen IX oxidase